MQIQLALDSTVYSIEAIQKAAYRFTGQFSCTISQGEKENLLEMTFDQSTAPAADEIISDFKKELLDQNLRLKIKDETEGIRNLILSYTFSKTGIQS